MTFVLPSDCLQKKAVKVVAKEEPQPVEKQENRRTVYPHTSSIADAIERIKAKQKQMEEQPDSKVEMFKQMAKEEAQALAQKLPELDQSSNSDQSEGEEPSNPTSLLHEGGGDLKKLFKQIVRNANSKDKVNFKREYGPIMSKLAVKKTSNAEGVEIADGLNFKRPRNAPDRDQLEDLDQQQKKRPRQAIHPLQKEVLEAIADERNEDQSLEKNGEVDDWMPPTGQSGDGKTALNAKFGY